MSASKLPAVPPSQRSEAWERWSAAAPRLRPRLRDSAYLDVAALELGGSRDACGLAQRALGPGVHLTLVIDEPDVMVDVTEAMLTTWGKTIDQAVARAQANLLARSAEPFVSLAPGVWVGPWDDAYAASRATLPDLLSPLTSAAVVAVPDRDTLLVADGCSDQALDALVSCVGDLWGRSPYPITPQLFRCDEACWSPLTLPGDHPATARIQELGVEARRRGYAHQQGPLQRQVGAERYVASAEPCRSRDGRQQLRALWTEGVDTLLPAVDRVHLLQDTGEDGISSRVWVVSWETLRAQPGALEPTSLHLPRWRTGRFPEVAQLRRIAVPAERDPHTAAPLGQSAAYDLG